MSVFEWILCILVGYLLGCFPTADLLCRISGNEDVRKYGSGNAGSTNMLRVYGIRMGLITLVGDVVKSVLAVFLGSLLGRELGACVAGVAAVLGHDFPAPKRFKGGKGVASSFGVLVVLSPWITLACAAIFFIGFFLTRIVSINSMISLTLVPIAMLIFTPGDTAHIITAAILAVLVIIAHRSNIVRLIKGTENKIDFHKS